jgi:CBS domain-containing protein
MQDRTRVADIMTHRVIVLSEEDNLTQIAAGLEHFRFHHLPVVDDGKLVGMLSHRDILRSTIAGADGSAVAKTLEARFLEQTFVRDVMQTTVLSARAQDLVSDAAERMLTARVGALPVVDEQNTLVGIVTENDVLRFVATRGLLKGTVDDARGV